MVAGSGRSSGWVSISALSMSMALRRRWKWTSSTPVSEWPFGGMTSSLSKLLSSSSEVMSKASTSSWPGLCRNTGKNNPLDRLIMMEPACSCGVGRKHVGVILVLWRSGLQGYARCERVGSSTCLLTLEARLRKDVLLLLEPALISCLLKNGENISSLYAHLSSILFCNQTFAV